VLESVLLAFHINLCFLPNHKVQHIDKCNWATSPKNKSWIKKKLLRTYLDPTQSIKIAPIPPANYLKENRTSFNITSFHGRNAQHHYYITLLFILEKHLFKKCKIIFKIKGKKKKNSILRTCLPHKHRLLEIRKETICST